MTDDATTMCRWCGDDQVALYVGYSMTDEVLDVERTFICEMCETIVLRDVDDF